MADELAENLSRAVQAGRRLSLKICGPKNEVLSALREISGVVYAETTAERDGEAYTYLLECKAGVDVRKNIFFTMAKNGWAIVGLEVLGMSLEDIFITIVDTSSKPTRPSSKTRRGTAVGVKGAMEKELAGEMLRKTAEGQKSDTEKT